MHSEKVTFGQTHKLGPCMEKEEKPETRYIDSIREFGGNRSFADLYRLEQNREAWRATAKWTSRLLMMMIIHVPFRKVSL